MARLVFAAAGEEFEDDRIEDMEDWLSLKPTLPFGQLPSLTVDGDTLCQSNAIARHLAKQFGLAGNTNWEQAKSDMIVECVQDMMYNIEPAYREKNEEKRIEMIRNYIDELPGHMEKLEKLLADNEHFVGDELTWADLCVMNAWYWIPGFGVTVPIDDFPKLKAHKERVETLPRIADWIARRPVTPV